MNKPRPGDLMKVGRGTYRIVIIRWKPGEKERQLKVELVLELADP